MLAAMTGVTLDDVGGWAGVLGALTAREDLAADVAGAAMAEILDGNATSAQIAAFIVALRMKGETVAELTGLVGAMAERATARLVVISAEVRSPRALVTDDPAVVDLARRVDWLAQAHAELVSLDHEAGLAVATPLPPPPQASSAQR